MLDSESCVSRLELKMNDPVEPCASSSYTMYVLAFLGHPDGDDVRPVLQIVIRVFTTLSLTAHSCQTTISDVRAIRENVDGLLEEVYYANGRTAFRTSLRGTMPDHWSQETPRFEDWFVGLE